MGSGIVVRVYRLAGMWRGSVDKSENKENRERGSVVESEYKEIRASIFKAFSLSVYFLHILIYFPSGV